MRKSFATDDHKDLLSAAGGHAFQFFERSDRFSKSASDVITRKEIQAHMPPDDHFGIHLITMGEEENFGPNRNGDSFSKNCLAQHHGSFEKHAHVYREHANRNPTTQGVGHVKLAKHNTKMHRGELIIWVAKDKAPDMYKEAKEGKELSFSMSCRLKSDECSCCHKKSARVDTYCSHLRDKMLQYVPGFEKFAYARNEEDVRFFDISEVARRADRIASYLGYSFADGEAGIAKAASAAEDLVINGSDWARHVLGADRIAEFLPWEMLTLEKLAQATDFVRHADSNVLSTLASMAPQTLSQDRIDTLASQDFRDVGGELAKKGMVLNFPTFASLVTSRSVSELEKDADFDKLIETKMPSMVDELFRNGGSGCGEDVAAAVTPDECGCSLSPGKDRIDTLMSEVGDELGMSPDKSQGRAMKVTIVKQASLRRLSFGKSDATPFNNGLAEAYGHYVVKAAHVIKDLPNINEKTLYRVLAASLLT